MRFILFLGSRAACSRTKKRRTSSHDISWFSFFFFPFSCPVSFRSRMAFQRFSELDLDGIIYVQDSYLPDCCTWLFSKGGRRKRFTWRCVFLQRKSYVLGRGSGRQESGFPAFPLLILETEEQNRHLVVSFGKGLGASFFFLFLLLIP